MGQAVPTQHPAVVLRSHFNQLRALLAVALIAVIGLTLAVVILANDENQPGDSSSATPIGRINYGGFNPATGRPESAPLPQQEHPLRSRLGTTQPAAPITGSRYDGGPEEGTSGPVKDYSMNGATGDYAHGPLPPDPQAKDYSKNAADGSAYGQLRRSGTDDQPTERYDGGPEEGSRGYGGFNPATGRTESAPPPQKEHPLRSRIGNNATTPAATSAPPESVCGEAVDHPVCRRP